MIRKILNNLKDKIEKHKIKNIDAAEAKHEKLEKLILTCLMVAMVFAIIFSIIAYKLTT